MSVLILPSNISRKTYSSSAEQVPGHLIRSYLFQYLPRQTLFTFFFFVVQSIFRKYFHNGGGSCQLTSCIHHVFILLLFFILFYACFMNCGSNVLNGYI